MYLPYVLSLLKSSNSLSVFLPWTENPAAIFQLALFEQEHSHWTFFLTLRLAFVWIIEHLRQIDFIYNIFSNLIHLVT